MLLSLEGQAEHAAPAGCKHRHLMVGPLIGLGWVSNENGTTESMVQEIDWIVPSICNRASAREIYPSETLGAYSSGIRPLIPTQTPAILGSKVLFEGQS